MNAERRPGKGGAHDAEDVRDIIPATADTSTRRAVSGDVLAFLYEREETDTAAEALPGLDELHPGTRDDLTRLIRRARHEHGGPLPVLSDPSWRHHPPIVRAGTIAVAALLHQLDTTPTAVRRRHAEDNLLAAARWRAASADLSAAADWSAAARRPSWAELCRRRGDGGAA